jgi:hypothetical protein
MIERQPIQSSGSQENGAFRHVAHAGRGRPEA